MKKLMLTLLSIALLAGAGYGCAHKAEVKSNESAVTTPADAGPAPAAAEPAPAPVNAPPN